MDAPTIDINVLGRGLAELVWPYVLEKLTLLGLVGSGTNVGTERASSGGAIPTAPHEDTSTPSASPDWTKYAKQFGPTALPRAIKFYEALASSGRLTSHELAVLMGVSNAQDLPATITNRLKQAADRLNMSRPFKSRKDAAHRVYWTCPKDIAAQIALALKSEEMRRAE